MDNNEHIAQVAKQVADVTAYTTIGATLMGWLPSIAAAFSIVWICIQIYESKTFGKLRAKLRRKKQ